MSSEKKSTQESDEMIDAESIFIYKAIKKCNKNVQIMIELGTLEIKLSFHLFSINIVHSTNIEFLLPKDVREGYKQDGDPNHSFTPLFAAGEVYISAIIDTLTCQVDTCYFADNAI